MTKQMTKDSKKLSYILRHHPEEFNCTMDSYGWVLVQDILDNIQKKKANVNEALDKFINDHLDELIKEIKGV